MNVTGMLSKLNINTYIVLTAVIALQISCRLHTINDHKLSLYKFNDTDLG